MNSDGLVTSIPIVEGVLDHYATALGPDFIRYRNHVHRVVNLCLAVTPGGRDNIEKIAVAAAFHDLGIWTDRTWDYIAPSISLAREYLRACSRADWIPEIEAMIANHHKITSARARSEWLVEGFRRADWIDVSCGFRRFGVARSLIKSLFVTWPSAGFHWRLVELTVAWFPRHPLRLFRGRGCQQCAGSGFSGRLGVFELFEVTGEIGQMIANRADGLAIRRAALAGGMKTMLHDGMAKAFLGETTLQEVFRVAI